MPVATLHCTHPRAHTHTYNRLNQLNHRDYSACSHQPLRSPPKLPEFEGGSRWNGRFSFLPHTCNMPTHVPVQLGSVWHYTGAAATNNVESADVYSRHRLWCERWDVSLKVIPGCVHSSIWWMPAGLSEGCMPDLKVLTASLLTSVLFWHHPCYCSLVSVPAAGSNVDI